MNYKILLLSLCFLVSLVAKSNSWQQILTGTVIDATTGEPLPGVDLKIKGTNNGTMTDSYGNFSIPKPETGAIFVFSFVGYKSEKITYSGQETVDIKLSPEVTLLDEAVVIGYGTIKKSDLTGAVGSINSKVLEKSTSVNIGSAMQGQVPGLMATSNAGDPAAEPVILIRGIGTVNNTTPIYVVDGMLIDKSDPSNRASNIAFLNPADVASIEVLKDASAQAIYGSRGANGVILITTKKGAEGAPKITFSTSFAYENLILETRLLNAAEYKDWWVTSNYNDYMRVTDNPDPNVDPDTIFGSREVVERYNTGVNTDWMHEILRNDRFSQNYDFSLTGGTKDFHYAASAGYLDKKGLLQQSEYKRYSFRLNTDYKAGKHITMGENLGITSSAQEGDWYQTGIISSAMGGDPTYPVLKPDSLVDPRDPNYYINKYAPMGNSTNPVTETILQEYPRSVLTIAGNIFGELKLFKQLKFRSSWGFNLARQEQSHYTPTYFISDGVNNPVSKLEEWDWGTNGWVWENTLTWNKIFGLHNITALLGYTSEYKKNTNQYGSKQGIPGNDPELQTFDAATYNPVLTGSYNTISMVSYFARINYSFADRYLLTATVRRDGSSKFGPGHKWGTFPSFSLGWKINEEPFFKNATANFFNDLKLRAGWGQIGNSSLPVNNAYVSLLGTTSPTTGADYRYNFGNNVYSGYWLTTMGTEDITWETTGQINFGIDISILKGALTFTADYYIKDTKNMLLQVPAVYYAGYPYGGSPYTNEGSVRNNGYEVLLNYQGRSGNFSYGASVNFSSFRNEVTSLRQGKETLNSNTPAQIAVGHPISAYYGFVTDGIFQNAKEVSNYKGPNGTVLQPNAFPGDFRFKNINNDETIDGFDQTWIGNPWPKLTYGFTINLGFKSFDLVAFFQGSYGNDIYDGARQYGYSIHKPPNEYFYKNAWRGEGTSNSIPAFSTVDWNGSYYNYSDFYVDNGSYMRLKNLQLGYNLPKPACEKLKISGCRFWIGGTNLFTITKYHGNDPEVGATENPLQGAGFDNHSYYPKPSEYSMGLTLSF
ncbi:MAG: TonB-dependent receptor [Bacteroidales bacterium]